VRDRFLARMQLDSVLCCVFMILDRSRIVPPVLEVHSEFCGKMGCPFAIVPLFPFSHTLMQLLPLPGGDAREPHVSREGMTESISCSSPPVG
jgi:hypothetical protein